MLAPRGEDEGSRDCHKGNKAAYFVNGSVNPNEDYCCDGTDEPGKKGAAPIDLLRFDGHQAAHGYGPCRDADHCAKEFELHLTPFRCLPIPAS